MEVQLRLTTPPGKATSTNKTIGWIIMPTGSKWTPFINSNDSVILYNIECNIHQALELQKNIHRYQSLMTGVLNNKIFLKMIRKKATTEQIIELKDMLLNQTTIEIIKEADLKEQDEYTNNWFKKIKEKVIN